jgi:hypothetical protein
MVSNMIEPTMGGEDHALVEQALAGDKGPLRTWSGDMKSRSIFKTLDKQGRIAYNLIHTNSVFLS